MLDKKRNKKNARRKILFVHDYRKFFLTDVIHLNDINFSLLIFR